MNTKKSKTPVPRPVVKLLGEDGNAYSITARCVKAGRKAGWTRKQQEAFTEECKSGDYEHLLRTAVKWCNTGIDSFLPLVKEDNPKMSESRTLKAGDYYVGDLCYVLDESNGYDWGKVLERTGYLGLHDPKTGKRLTKPSSGHFKLDGVEFFSSRTQYGDGSYQDKEGRTYLIDAGLIGCFPVSALPKDIGDCARRGGNVITFDKPFVCEPVDDNGVIRIGHLTINTGNEED